MAAQSKVGSMNRPYLLVLNVSICRILMGFHGSLNVMVSICILIQNVALKSPVFILQLFLVRAYNRVRRWGAGLRKAGAISDNSALKDRLVAGFKHCQISLRALRMRAAQKSGEVVRPERVSAWISFALVVLAAIFAAYWLMRFARVVFPPQASAKGVVFYEAASNLRVRTLFGEKDFDPSRLTLRGVVLTGEVNGVNQGMALIEVDGKPAETLELGDMMAPGIRLEKISPEGVMIRYQGRSYELQQSTMNR